MPVISLSPEARSPAVRMLAFLNKVSTSSRLTLAKKASEVLVNQLISELQATSVISRPAELKSAKFLCMAGKLVHSLVAASSYVQQVFRPLVLPTDTTFRAFLVVTSNLCGQDVTPALAKELLEKVIFVPKVFASNQLFRLALFSIYNQPLYTNSIT